MIRVNVLYQNAEGKKFDMAYYCSKHIPMVKKKLGSACIRVDVDQGLGGAQKAFGPHADAIMGDIPNYTDIQPLIQVSEVKM
jgi:hypothetical protein